MQKIRNAVFERMLAGGLTNAEVDFILHLSHYQDDNGHVSGVYYRDICEGLKLSFQTFYDVLHSLEEKEFLKVEKAHYGDWDITIRDNRFPEGVYGHYISTGDDIFFKPEFRELKGAEKLLAMQFLKITKNPENGGKYRIDAGRFREKYCGVLKVTWRVLQGYLRSLKRFFSIGRKNGLLFIRPLSGTGQKREAPKDKELLKEQIGKAVIRRQRATYTPETFRDTVNLISQYASELKDRVEELFGEAVEESLRLRNSKIKNHYKWDRELQPKLIHKLLTEKIRRQGAGADLEGSFVSL